MRWLFFAYALNALAWLLVVRSTIKYLISHRKLVNKIKSIDMNFYNKNYRDFYSMSGNGNCALWEHILHPEDVPEFIKLETISEFREAHDLVIHTIKLYITGFITVAVLGYSQRTFI